MKTPLTLIGLCAAALLLGACDKTPLSPPKPTLSSPVPTESGTIPAESVFPLGSDAKSDPALGETDGTRKPKEESEEKLLPGQNNDHSAPLSPPK